MTGSLAALLLVAALPAGAQTLQFPGNASLRQEVTSPLDSYAMPVDIWTDGVLPTQVVEGELTRQAWRIATSSLTTLQVLRPLREQLRNDGYDILFECQTEACGGFDFRFGVETLAPPAMQVDIGNYRFLAAAREGDEGTAYVSLFVSRTAQAGFVQVTQVLPAATEGTAPLAEATAPPVGQTQEDRSPLASRLDVLGHAVLEDLTFDTGSSQLGQGDFASLAALADYLADRPNRRVALVGHTDAEGSLDGNIALSKRRAGSVLERLVSDYGVSRRQLAAEGMGYLSPVASNLTDAGRTANRRVEVIITSDTE